MDKKDENGAVNSAEVSNPAQIIDLKGAASRRIRVKDKKPARMGDGHDPLGVLFPLSGAMERRAKASKKQAPKSTSAIEHVQEMSEPMKPGTTDTMTVYTATPAQTSSAEEIRNEAVEPVIHAPAPEPEVDEIALNAALKTLA